MQRSERAVNGASGLDADAPAATANSTPGVATDSQAHSAVTAPAATTARRGSTGGASGVAAASSAIAPHAPIKIGIGVDKNDQAFAAAFGVSTSQPAERDIAAAVVADINKNGGLAGHPIDPVYKELDSTSSNWIAEDQAACETFTRDNHVIAAIRTNDLFGPLDGCLADAGVPLVLYESVFRAPSWYQQANGLRFTPDGPNATRLFGALIDRMAATGRWTPSTKIGLVRYDRSDQAPIEKDAIRAALARHGMTLTASEAVHTPEGFQDIAPTTSQLPGVIVRFRQLGIDNVMFMGGDLSYLFATAADAQSYMPKYALTSYDFPNGMPTDQLHGAFGAGWEPTDDLLTPLPARPGTTRCEQATRSTNANYSAAGADRDYITCDSLYFLQAAYNAAGAVGPGALASGAARLAAGWAPAFTFAADFAGHPDGVAAYRDLSFDEHCTCLVYGDQHALP